MVNQGVWVSVSSPMVRAASPVDPVVHCGVAGREPGVRRCWQGGRGPSLLLDEMPSEWNDAPYFLDDRLAGSWPAGRSSPMGPHAFARYEDVAVAHGEVDEGLDPGRSHPRRQLVRVIGLGQDGTFLVAAFEHKPAASVATVAAVPEVFAQFDLKPRWADRRWEFDVDPCDNSLSVGFLANGHIEAIDRSREVSFPGL